ncbi:alpha-tocopherol transfer protein-like [Aplysia californica]|uniref:Alpha-tocopherol transfer protein-like n=1 Tax=Aplysia californica TaxID=6500 RepID=A0ABM1A2H9_APLCA|nr:alpha-tocopherol transfer protein-like [Aplysia californica]
MSIIPDSEYVCSLSQAALAKAREELREDPDTRLAHVCRLRRRLQQEQGLNARTDVLYLLPPLRASKYDQDRAFTLVTNLYKMKRKRPDLFQHLKPSTVRDVIDRGVCEVLEQRDSEGCRVVLMRIGKCAAKQSAFLDLVKTVMVIVAKSLEEEETQVHGIRFLILLQGTTLSHLGQLRPGFLHLTKALVQDVAPVRLKHLDFFHEPLFFGAAFKLLKGILRTKLVRRVHLHGSRFDRLHSVMPASCLPRDLGGTLEAGGTTPWTEALFASEWMFEEALQYGYVT